MEGDEQQDIKTIVDILKDVKEIKISGDEKKDFKFYGISELDTIKNYASLATIKILKQKPEYYLSKWTIIMNHLINLDDYFFYLEKTNNYPNEDNQNNKIIEYKKRRKKKQTNTCFSNINNSQSSSTSEEIFSSGTEESSEIENNSIGQISSNNNIQDKDINEFTLNYMRKNMKVITFDQINGNSFEDYVKRTFFLMLLILKIDYYDFLHPTEVLYKKLIELNNIKDPEMVSDVFEIDLVLIKNDIKNFK